MEFWQNLAITVTAAGVWFRALVAWKDRRKNGRGRTARSNGRTDGLAVFIGKPRRD